MIRIIFKKTTQLGTPEFPIFVREGNSRNFTLVSDGMLCGDNEMLFHVKTRSDVVAVYDWSKSSYVHLNKTGCNSNFIFYSVGRDSEVFDGVKGIDRRGIEHRDVGERKSSKNNLKKRIKEEKLPVREEVSESKSDWKADNFINVKDSLENIRFKDTSNQVHFQDSLKNADLKHPHSFDVKQSSEEFDIRSVLASETNSRDNKIFEWPPTTNKIVIKPTTEHEMDNESEILHKGQNFRTSLWKGESIKEIEDPETDEIAVDDHGDDGFDWPPVHDTMSRKLKSKAVKVSEEIHVLNLNVSASDSPIFPIDWPPELIKEAEISDVVENEKHSHEVHENDGQDNQGQQVVSEPLSTDTPTSTDKTVSGEKVSDSVINTIGVEAHNLRNKSKMSDSLSAPKIVDSQSNDWAIIVCALFLLIFFTLTLSSIRYFKRGKANLTPKQSFVIMNNETDESPVLYQIQE
ncbi:hypothetical protein ROZALSC1DRAFT_31360 [Rozella allomycis CSF55]|uniref:Uncharacterized protein n=1 Tax=Rozella allomycis (strain CSF55) TaxID=988480 RepID=A0A4V1IZ45_ROZAC|nr:hypothetical protein ROZALSC1DRAFT_31360 [Rozella allomycis CSF55]